MQGVSPRFKSKKALKEVVATGAFPDVSLIATSMFGNEYGGPLDKAPDGKYFVVGPCPYTDRRWYAAITVAKGKVSIK